MTKFPTEATDHWAFESLYGVSASEAVRLRLIGMLFPFLLSSSLYFTSNRSFFLLILLI